MVPPLLLKCFFTPKLPLNRALSGVSVEGEEGEKTTSERAEGAA